MTFPQGGSERWREETALRLLAGTRQRAAANEAVGILQVWHACAREQARDDLDVTGTTAGREVEARRIIAVIDAAATGRADPDARWD
ncbi:hypothetical protein [Amycolatopsis sp. NPDC051128]|uniref:hypothetical protein n=1 Tax=Amycolatopsis sp. NPDC051128 TaxID=3155412 RepID=UPI0034330FAD